ncbi:MAG: zf-HC2 domain-containing protein [Snowella sp.]|nr:zf-HC2 domain-containing protein [Snowella sp.]
MKSEFHYYEGSEEDLLYSDEGIGRFELLSAYLDGEVTAEERRQVQEWLDTDPKLKQTYLKLLRLQQGIPQITPPTPSISAHQLSERVFSQIDREQQRLRLLVCGGLAAAALGVFAVSNGVMEILNPFRPSLQSAFLEVESEPLQIALNQPIFEIPVEQ